MRNEATIEVGSVDRWVAGLPGRSVPDATIGDDLCKRVRVFADLNPHLPAGATGAWLLYRHGGIVTTVAVDRAHIIGRGSDATVKLDHPWMSRQHFSITPRDGDFYSEHFGSKNPLTINGRDVAGARLQSGDVICVGTQQFLFVIVR